MYIPKRYGESRTENCPFCDSRATTTNDQNVPVCMKHKNKLLDDLKCVCGRWLDLKDGKFGCFGESEGLPGDNVHTVLEDREGNIWAGGMPGLSRFSDAKVRVHGPAEGLYNELVSGAEMRWKQQSE